MLINNIKNKDTIKILIYSSGFKKFSKKFNYYLKETDLCF